jgi:MSHA biogenesis protein MshL
MTCMLNLGTPCIRMTMAAVAAGICLALMGGCAMRQPQPPPDRQMAELDRIQPHKILNRAKQRLQPGPPPFRELMAPQAKEITQPPMLYTLVFEKAPLGDVIAALTKDSEYNLAIESEVNLGTTVTVNLKNVTLEESLDMVVVNGAGYAWALEDGTLHIKRFVERIYQFDFLDMIGETNIDVGGDMLGSGVNTAGVAGKYQIKAQKTQSNSDLWKAVENALSGMKSEEGQLRLNTNAGIIYMADKPRKIAAMVGFLDSLSESLNRQVFIEARIMEVILDNDNKYGIDWTRMGILFTDADGNLPDLFELGFNSNGIIAKNNVSAYSALLDFLKTQGDVKILSNPHLLVMNRQSALLTVGRQLPYTEIDGVDRDTETNTVTIGATIRRALLGLQLGITPQIAADGMVTLHIVPTLTRVEQNVDIAVPTGGTSVQTISNPVIDLQELATMVRVREGNSFVLAGLISKIRSLNHEGLPVLGSLPGLGSLFKHMESREESSELVILITPYIVDSGSAKLVGHAGAENPIME